MKDSAQKKDLEKDMPHNYPIRIEVMAKTKGHDIQVTFRGKELDRRGNWRLDKKDSGK